jgi:hypothetical protein
MPDRCPWCLEPLRFRQRRAELCVHCGRPLTGSDGEPRELELRYTLLEARQRERVEEVLKWGVPIIAIVALGVSILHVAGLLVAPFVALIHLLVLRIFVIRDARRSLSSTRRLFTRWVARFAFLWLGLPGYASMAVPVAGIVGAVATFVVLTEIVHVYTAWSLARERDGLPLMAWESVLVGTLAIVTVLMIVAVVAAGLLVGWSAMAIIDWLVSE